jgi:hypothetical protein
LATQAIYSPVFPDDFLSNDKAEDCPEDWPGDFTNPEDFFVRRHGGGLQNSGGLSVGRHGVGPRGGLAGGLQNSGGLSIGRHGGGPRGGLAGGLQNSGGLSVERHGGGLPGGLAGGLHFVHQDDF